MWLKVTLLLIYLSVLFILARLLEAVTWYDQGQLSRRLLDPMTLSVLKLKALLEQRGVSYDSVVEKSELTELVEATGAVTEDEISSTTHSVEETSVTNYTCGMDFYEQVEDNKDSMWLIEVLVDSGSPTLLSENSWNTIRKKVSKFGFRLGRFDCHLDRMLCVKKGWYTSRLVLALPENHRSKSNVVLYSYPGSPVRITSLFDWMKTKIDAQIEVINDYDTFQSNWLTFDSSLNPEVRVIFTSTLSTVPLFLSALSVKFPGRVKIASINVKSTSGKNVSKKGQIYYVPSYLIVTPERRYYYGHHTGELYSFRSMELFLKSLHPSLNDVFIVSMIFTNLLSCFEISLSSGTFMKRFIKLLWCVFKYNMVLLLLWIGLLAIFQLPLIEIVSLYALKVLRYFAGSDFFALIRKDIMLYSTNVLFTFSLLLTLLLVVWILKRIYGNENEDIEETDWLNFTNIRTLQYSQWTDLYVSPFDRIFNPRVFGFTSTNTIDQDQPYVSKDYINNLPIWYYRVTHLSADSLETTGSRSCSSVNKTETRNQNKSFPLLDQQTSEVTVGSILDGNYVCACEDSCCCDAAQANRNPVDQEPPTVAREQASTAILEEDQYSAMPYSKKYKIEKRRVRNCAPSGYLEDKQCVICLESYFPWTVLCGLPCRHAFHDKCILEWLLRDNHLCPVCRWPAYQQKALTVSNLHTD